MPDANDQWQFQDFFQELTNRGFSGFSPTDLAEMINRAYLAVARRTRWYWEEASAAFTLNPGSYQVSTGKNSAELPGFRSLNKLFVTTDSQRRRLVEMEDDPFFNNWLALDLTATSNQGEPSNYYLWNNNLMILPPPNGTRDFLAYYHRDVTKLLSPTDVPISPIKYDEAILQGALVRCHQRSLEPQLAAEAQAALAEIYEDMLDEEETRIGEHLDRVKPDDTWA